MYLKFISVYVVVSAVVAFDENNNTSEYDSKYLNNFLNISNGPPEQIEYYDLEDETVMERASMSPEIYPDPDKMPVSRHDNDAGDYAGTEKAPEIVVSGSFDVVVTIADVSEPFLESHSPGRSNDEFKEHDTIDNIMYIYYGSTGAMRKSFGGSVIIVGAVFALGAQILAVVLSMLRNRRQRRQNPLTSISLNLLSTLCASNFVFIVGVQASKTLFKCEMIAILLHYFHLSTSLWGLMHTYSIYDFVINDMAPNLRYNNLIAYGGSGVYVLFSFVVSSASYETFDYCWMSVQRGMIVNFMIPISALIVATTIFGTLTLRGVAAKQREVIVESIENILEKCQHIDAVGGGVVGSAGNVMPSVMEKCCDEMDKMCDTELKRIDFYDSKFDLGALSIADLSLQSSNESQDFADFKQAVKFSLFFQPAFAVCWFLGVVALENRQSSVMPIAFTICYNILNWYILYRSANISPLITTGGSGGIGGNTGNGGCNTLSGRSHQTTSLNVDNMSVGSHHHQQQDDHNHHSIGCTDTIPLLCSVTTPPPASHNRNIIDDLLYNNGNHMASESLQDINLWETGMESVNLECISTISN